MEKLTSPGVTRAVLAQFGIRARKKYGQNFLTDGNIVRGIVEAAGITKEDCVLEIGPGIGTMTQCLSEAARMVVCVEIDETLRPVLAQTLEDCDNVEILWQDILKTDLKALSDRFNEGRPLKVVANLPYYVTTPILLRLLEDKGRFESITVMVQKEVADRICAGAGSKEYGALSLAVQYYSSPEVVLKVPPACVSGGADSMALLWAMYLLREKLGIQLECAHFNHQLRGEESDRDAAFVRQFCADYHIPFHYGTEQVKAGEKGLEAAARDARYCFLRSLPGKVATAHTADDNLETVLMHLIRGTGLKGLGGIAPINGRIIRPMLNVTREDVLAFLSEYSVSYVEDSTNGEDAFLRNRLRHHIVPLMKAENPKLSQSLSDMALRLRLDEDYLQSKTALTADVDALKEMHPALRTRSIAAFLEKSGVKEPGVVQIEAVEELLYSEKPSASVDLTGGVAIGRNYGGLQVVENADLPKEMCINCPGSVVFGNYRIIASLASAPVNTRYAFTVSPVGQMVVRSRIPEDKITFAFGTKSLKKLFIDQKIPAKDRPFVPVIGDDAGLLGVCGFGADMQRPAEIGNLVMIKIEPL